MLDARSAGAARARPCSPACGGSGVGGHDRQRVGAEHRGEHVRVLVAGRRRVPAVVAQLEAAADRVGAAGRLRVVPRRGSPWTRARAGLGAPASRAIAGRTKSRKVTIAETGLPGSPKTSVPAAATPNQVGLAGLQRHPPEDLLDAERGERRLDVVVLADRDAAADRPRARRRAPRSIAARVASRSSRTCVDRARARRPRARRQRRRACSALELRIAAGPQRRPGLAAARRRWSATATRGRRAQATGPTPTDASTPSSAGPEPAPAREHASRRPRCPRRRGGRCRPASTAACDLDRRSPPPSVSSTRTTASAPSGITAPVEIAIASPGAERATRPGARRATRRRPQRRRRARRCAPAVSAARTREAVHRRVVEGRERGRRPRRRREAGRAPRPTGPPRAPSGEAAASTRARASSSEIGPAPSPILPHRPIPPPPHRTPAVVLPPVAFNVVVFSAWAKGQPHRSRTKGQPRWRRCWRVGRGGGSAAPRRPSSWRGERWSSIRWRRWPRPGSRRWSWRSR